MALPSKEGGDLMNKSEITSEIGRVTRDCSKPGWDGYDAEPVSAESARHAIAFVDRLPDGIVLPAEVTPEPDGEISLEWTNPSSAWLSLSFSSDGKILTFSYARRFTWSSIDGLLGILAVWGKQN